MKGSPVRVRASALSLCRDFLRRRLRSVVASWAEGSTRGLREATARALRIASLIGMRRRREPSRMTWALAYVRAVKPGSAWARCSATSSNALAARPSALRLPAREGAPLRAEGFHVNRKRIERLWRLEGHRVPP
jgi:hypothetical protein